MPCRAWPSGAGPAGLGGGRPGAAGGGGRVGRRSARGWPSPARQERLERGISRKAGRIGQVNARTATSGAAIRKITSRPAISLPSVRSTVAQADPRSEGSRTAGPAARAGRVQCRFPASRFFATCLTSACWKAWATRPAVRRARQGFPARGRGPSAPWGPVAFGHRHGGRWRWCSARARPGRAVPAGEELHRLAPPPVDTWLNRLAG